MSYEKTHETHEKSTTPVVKPKADVPAGKPVGPTLRVEETPAPVPPPAITSLAPPGAAVGDPSFGLHVLGSGFHPTAIIVFAGVDEPTTFFSDGDLVTGMNMPLWLGADQLAVQVRNPDGQVSNTVTFDLQGPRAVPLDPAAPSKPTPAVDQI